MHPQTNKQSKQSRRGTVAVMVALSITLLLGMVAIALDGGLLQDNKRRVQNAADGAALAAANKIFVNFPNILRTNTPDPNGQAAAAAQTNASDNGFGNDGTVTTVVANVPPTSGPFTNKIGYAEVIITYRQPRYFSGIWGSNATPIVARAVAKGYWGGTGTGVIVLDPDDSHSLDASGTGSVTVTGGAAVLVNSTDSEAGRQTGGGGLTASRFEVTGGTTGTFTGTVKTGVLPTPDPLAYLPAPSGLPNGTITQVNLTQGNKMYVVTPGKHTSFPAGQSGDIFVFKQASYNSVGGIYYLDGGGFTSTGATLIMDSATTGGIMIYNAPNSAASNQGISITGNASGIVNLSALTSGPYAGILFWQARTATQQLSISGNGSFNLSGTFYAPNANLQISGNGSAVIGSQYISRTLNLSGGGAMTINYSDDGTARKREVRLVE
jgi:hypothetical protein